MDYNFIYNDLKNTDVNDFTTNQLIDMKDFILTVIGAVPFTFEQIRDRMLASVPDTQDKRAGSIIYDALSPVAGELVQDCIQREIWKQETYVMTAHGDNLDKKGYELGLPRFPKTQAKRLGRFTDNNENLVNVPIGSRFTVPESSNTITYYVKEYQSTGIPILICEQKGTVGNDYTGDILPLFSISNLKTASIEGILEPARDVEIDEDYRARILARMRNKGFGGNIQDYKNYFADNFQSASEPKVYPVWNGGGTVKCSVLDSEFNAITEEFKQEIKKKIDPVEYEGKGIGIAPIGHTVTIDTPQETVINIVANVTLEGATVGQIQAQVEQYLEEYFLETRKTWVKFDTIRIFVSQVIANILKIGSVQNVTDVTLNGQENDIAMTSTAETQFIPVLGTVVLNERQ